MNKGLIIILIGGLVITGGIVFLLFGGFQGDTNNNTGTDSTGGKDQLPELSFEDYEGNTVSLASLQGKPLVVNSWATWCPFCVDELPDFAAVQQELGEEVVFIAIDRAESLSQAKKFSDDLGITDSMIFLLDPSDDFYKAIGGFSMPETIFVDRQGVIQDHKRGPMTAEEVRQRLQPIL